MLLARSGGIAPGVHRMVYGFAFKPSQEPDFVLVAHACTAPLPYPCTHALEQISKHQSGPLPLIGCGRIDWLLLWNGRDAKAEALTGIVGP